MCFIMDKCGSALEKNAAELTVLDVYDIAAVLGQEFENIIDQYGCEALTRLMPKVIRILEVLEGLVGRNYTNTENDELNMELQRLRLERKERMEKEKIREKELEQVEDMWRRENQDLLSQISDLQVQNKSLRMRLSLKDLQHTEEDFQQNEGTTESEHQLMKKLKDKVDQQQDEIKAKDHEITLKKKDTETLQMQLHRVKKINQDLKHHISIVEAQGKALIHQRAKLEALSQAMEQEVGSVKKELACLKEQHQEKAIDLAIELPDCSSPRQQCKSSPMQLEALCEDNQGENNRCIANHIIPQFTLEDLQDVLQDKNKLKAQVFVLQEELAYYKREEELEEQISPLVPVHLTAPQPSSNNQPESGIKKLLFTAVMPMVAAGLINDDPTLQLIKRLISVV